MRQLIDKTNIFLSLSYTDFYAADYIITTYVASLKMSARFHIIFVNRIVILSLYKIYCK